MWTSKTYLVYFEFNVNFDFIVHFEYSLSGLIYSGWALMRAL
jgi:hypothetical protein